MKAFKIISVLAAVLALTGLPGFFNTLPPALDYRMGYALLVFGHALAGLSIIVGAILSLKGKVNISKWLLILGCCFAAYGKFVEGYHFQYPLFYTFKYSSFEGFKEFQNGYSIDFVFGLLAALLIYFQQKAEIESQNKPAQVNPCNPSENPRIT